MTRELPEYTGDLAYCQPCGWSDALTEYVPAIAGLASVSRRIDSNGVSRPAQAYLKRTCERCGFQWAEATLPPREDEDEDEDRRCDVYAMSGARCTEPPGHFSRVSPHRFPDREGPTLLLGQGDCQGPCCGGDGPPNYDH